MWCAIGAYVVMAGRYAGERRAGITVSSLRVTIAGAPRTQDSTATAVITPDKIAAWLAEAEINPVGRSIDEAGTGEIERRIAAHPEVKHVSAWSDLNGALTIRVEPRTPALRVRTSGGYRFWLSTDGVIMADRGDYTAYVPVVTGDIPFPFSPTAEGSYEQMRRDNYNDFLGRYIALDDERRTLQARAAEVRGALRATRAGVPKRWWGQARKKAFAEMRAARIAELESQRVHLAGELTALRVLEEALKEKEKKSYQSYRFLSKLANFVEFIGGDDFWASQIVQIHAVGGGRNSALSAAGGTSESGVTWREPQLELIPRAGDHTVLLGELDGTERARLENLRLFYLDGLRHEGWNTHGYINIKYNNQIVCTE
jgi:cell division protein FtsQ